MKYENDIIMADHVADESYSDSYSSICYSSVYLYLGHNFDVTGSVLVNDFWTPPPSLPPPINFVHDQFSIHLVLLKS